MNLGFETEVIEFKKSTGEIKEAMFSIAAILNKHQAGELYFGVLPDGNPIGQIITEKTLRDVSNAIKNHIEPKIYPEIELVHLNDRSCIHVRFEGTDVPYYAYNQVRIRVADEDLPMSPQEIEKRYMAKNDASNLWENVVSDWKINDVKEEVLQNFIEKAHEEKRISFEYTDTGAVLNKLFLTKGDNILNAGAVLFCDTSYCELQMAIFASNERLTFNDIQRHHGTIFELADIAERYIINNMHWRVEFDGSLKRKEIPEVPVEAIREALINSFCHKDYNARQCNEVVIFKNRIEIYNPGIFPIGYIPEDFINEDLRPVRRNPLIAGTLYYSRDVESFGTGLRRITKECDKAGVKVEFKMIKSGFVVIFYRRDYKEMVDSSDKVAINKKLSTTDSDKIAINESSKTKNSDKIAINESPAIKNSDKVAINEKISTKSSDKNEKVIYENLSARELQIIEYLYKNDFITNNIARDITGLAVSTTRKLLSELVKKEILIPSGERKARRYMLKQKIDRN